MSPALSLVVFNQEKIRGNRKNLGGTREQQHIMVVFGPTHARQLLLAAVLVFGASWVFLAHTERGSSTMSSLRGTVGAKLGHHGDGHAKGSVYNSTLGFEKVFTISLPNRTDKRDALSLMSALTGFRITWIDGIRGASIPDKALPVGWDRKGVSDTVLGSWRGHMNAIRRIIDEGLTSALIMEDDMDWDVSLKDRLADFAGAARELQDRDDGSWFIEPPSCNTSIPGRDSPYGQDWDMLWIGSCASIFASLLPEYLQIPDSQRDDREVLITNDDTVPPKNHRTGNAGWSWDEYPDETRVVYVPGDNTCSFAYALSQTGARRALEYMSLRGQHKAFDNHLSDLCRTRANGMRCVSVVPSLFVHHRARGMVSADSDIQPAGGDGEFRELGSTENVLYSTRLNLQRLLRGEKPLKQWED
ncbi:glycosyl transferase family 25 [Microdochium nivale]|nr:glycosyl transferase family 25 [Microdochium nivale]